MASKQNLADACRAHGLSVTGNKDELLERLLGEEHILKAVLAAKPSRKASKETSSILKKTISKEKGKNKKSEFEAFCDEHRPMLLAAGLTDPQTTTKLNEMWKAPTNKQPAFAVTSHVGSIDQMPPEVRAKLMGTMAPPPVGCGGGGGCRAAFFASLLLSDRAVVALSPSV